MHKREKSEHEKVCDRIIFWYETVPKTLIILGIVAAFILLAYAGIKARRKMSIVEPNNLSNYVLSWDGACEATKLIIEVPIEGHHYACLKGIEYFIIDGISVDALAFQKSIDSNPGITILTDGKVGWNTIHKGLIPLMLTSTMVLEGETQWE